MSRPRPTSTIALLPVLLLVLSACGAGAGSPTASESGAPPATASPPVPTESTAATEPPEASASESADEEVRVRIEMSVYDPRELTIPAGTTVAFRNSDTFAHTITEGTGGQAVDSPVVDREIAQSRTIRVTFDEPGTYEITCKFHPSMQMTIVVEG